MKIFMLGATGRTGTIILLEALKRGHNVTALVRSPSSLDNFISTLSPTQKSNLNLVRGSPLNASDVSTAIATVSATASANEQLVVISALNARRTSDNPWAAPHPTDSPPRMMGDSIANVIAALKQANLPVVPKVIHLSALGVGRSAPQAHWILRTMVAHSNLKLAYKDHEAVEEELNAAGDSVKWVVLRPGVLADGDDGSTAKVWPADKGVGMTAKSSKTAVARFCLDAAEGSEWDGKDPIILN